MKKSYIAAVVIAVLAILYFVLHALLIGSPKQTRAAPATSEQTQRFKAVVQTLHAVTRPGVLVLRGRSEALRSVSVRAETAGSVAATPTLEGTQVKKGDVLCRLSLQARQAMLDQARATSAARKLEWQAASTLVAKGHRSATQAASARAAYDAARAAVRQAEIELANINIRAPFDGVFVRRDAEIGDYLTPGQSCGVVAQLDPLIVAANVTEQDVIKVHVGMKGHAVLATGQNLSGVVRYVDPVADPGTRTFRIEVLADNHDGLLRAGMTADLRLEGAPVLAHRIPADTMVLNDKGLLGVRIVDNNNHVRFYPVKLIDDAGKGVWVSGLPKTIRLIVEGQDFVRAGSLVDAVPQATGNTP